MKKNDRIAKLAIELSDEELKLIESSTMSPKYNYLNKLLEQCPPEKMKRDKEDEDWLK